MRRTQGETGTQSAVAKAVGQQQPSPQSLVPAAPSPPGEGAGPRGRRLAGTERAACVPSTVAASGWPGGCLFHSSPPGAQSPCSHPQPPGDAGATERARGGWRRGRASPRFLSGIPRGGGCFLASVCHLWSGGGGHSCRRRPGAVALILPTVPGPPATRDQQEGGVGVATECPLRGCCGVCGASWAFCTRGA